MQTIHKYLRPCAVLLASFLGIPTTWANIVIDHSDIQAVSSYSQATMDAIAQNTFYFEHASVGSNIVSGINSLHSSNPTFYRLTTSAISGSDEGVSSLPSSIAAGTVYEYARGNPPWSAKVSRFSANITGKWAGKTTFALNKFCYIDQTASWETYSASMDDLEDANPGTKFVYMTMPLTTGSDYDNVLRNQFNSSLRAWAAKYDKILFDIADIEASDASGTLTTFDYAGTTYQQMDSDWAMPDGGHLNSDGENRAALGFYALAAEFTAVPEPSTYAAILGLATLGLVLWQHCRSTRLKP